MHLHRTLYQLVNNSSNSNQLCHLFFCFVFGLFYFSLFILDWRHNFEKDRIVNKKNVENFCFHLIFKNYEKMSKQFRLKLMGRLIPNLNNESYSLSSSSSNFALISTFKQVKTENLIYNCFFWHVKMISCQRTYRNYHVWHRHRNDFELLFPHFLLYFFFYCY